MLKKETRLAALQLKFEISFPSQSSHFKTKSRRMHFNAHAFRPAISLTFVWTVTRLVFLIILFFCFIVQYSWIWWKMYIFLLTTQHTSNVSASSVGSTLHPLKASTSPPLHPTAPVPELPRQPQWSLSTHCYFPKIHFLHSSLNI